MFSDGHEKHINFLHEEQGPASLLFVLDVSGSMGKPLAYVQDARKRVLRAAAADDEFGVIEFSDGARLTVDFTSMQSRVEERISDMRATGRTLLIDALDLALREIPRANQMRRAMIVISDGGDNYSRHVETEVARLALETDGRIYAIELYPTFGDWTTILERLAMWTGGQYLPTMRHQQIPQLATLGQFRASDGPRTRPGGSLSWR